jgi:hypothetical protein
METLNRNAGAQASGEHRGKALFGARVRDDSSLRRRVAIGTSAITMRLGWLARAAFVFGMSGTGSQGPSTRFSPFFEFLLLLCFWRLHELWDARDCGGIGRFQFQFLHQNRYPIFPRCNVQGAWSKR